jgi:hypothetical protein
MATSTAAGQILTPDLGNISMGMRGTAVQGLGAVGEGWVRGALAYTSLLPPPPGVQIGIEGATRGVPNQITDLPKVLGTTNNFVGEIGVRGFSRNGEGVRGDSGHFGVVGRAESTDPGVSGFATIGVSGFAPSAAGRNTGVLGHALAFGESTNSTNGGNGVVGLGGLNGVVGQKVLPVATPAGFPNPDYGTYGVLSRGHLGVDTNGAIVSLNNTVNGFIPFYALTGNEVGTFFRVRTKAVFVGANFNTQNTNAVLRVTIPVPPEFKAVTEGPVDDPLNYTVQVTPRLGKDLVLASPLVTVLHPLAWVVSADLNTIVIEAGMQNNAGTFTAIPAGIENAIPLDVVVNGVRKNYAGAPVLLPNNGQIIAATVDESDPTSNGLVGQALSGMPAPRLEDLEQP